MTIVWLVEHLFTKKVIRLTALKYKQIQVPLSIKLVWIFAFGEREGLGLISVNDNVFISKVVNLIAYSRFLKLENQSNE